VRDRFRIEIAASDQMNYFDAGVYSRVLDPSLGADFNAVVGDSLTLLLEDRNHIRARTASKRKQD